MAGLFLFVFFQRLKQATNAISQTTDLVLFCRRVQKDASKKQNGARANKLVTPHVWIMRGVSEKSKREIGQTGAFFRQLATNGDVSVLPARK